jgi:hypothetical protein
LTLTITTTKKILLLTLTASTFLLGLVSYVIPLQSQQAFGQGAFQTEDNDQSPPPLITDASNNETNQTGSTTPATENNQKIILGDITIPITADTKLSLEIPDSIITVEPNK